MKNAGLLLRASFFIPINCFEIYRRIGVIHICQKIKTKNIQMADVDKILPKNNTIICFNRTSNVGYDCI